MNTRVNLLTSRLVLDDLINMFHSYMKWSVEFLATKAVWEYSIDLTCLEYITSIESSTNKFIQITRFTTHFSNSSIAASGFLRVEYTVHELNSTTFTANLHIANAQKIVSLVLNYNPMLETVPARAFWILSKLVNLKLGWNNIGPDQNGDYLQQSSFEGWDI